MLKASQRQLWIYVYIVIILNLFANQIKNTVMIR